MNLPTAAPTAALRSGLCVLLLATGAAQAQDAPPPSAADGAAECEDARASTDAATRYRRGEPARDPDTIGASPDRPVTDRRGEPPQEDR